jgi:hypothetical protein
LLYQAKRGQPKAAGGTPLAARSHEHRSLEESSTRRSAVE